MKKFFSFTAAMLLMMSLLLAGCSSDDGKKEEGKSKEEPKTEKPAEMILATTTSTQDSGLLDELIPAFEEKYNVKVKTIAVGTGEALAMGTRGEADALLTHAPKSEQEIVDSGDAINYKRVMYNDFIIVGPSADPAKINGLNINDAFAKINEENAVFVSRGDDSGTHKKELDIWASADLDPESNSNYLESGQGMGQTLQLAAEKQGYVLTDRATYLAQKSNLSDFEILVEGDEILKNIYHVMQVNPEKHDKVNAESGKQFVEFMISDEAHAIIEKFGVSEYGEALFYSDRE